MKEWKNQIVPGLKLTYDGEDIEWINRKSGNTCNIMRRGNYVVVKVDENFIHLKHDRKGAITVFKIRAEEFKLNRIYEYDFSDLTSISIFFLPRYSWYINKPYLFKEAKRVNAGKRSSAISLSFTEHDYTGKEAKTKLFKVPEKWLKEKLFIPTRKKLYKFLNEYNSQECSDIYRDALMENAILEEIS